MWCSTFRICSVLNCLLVATVVASSLGTPYGNANRARAAFTATVAGCGGPAQGAEMASGRVDPLASRSKRMDMDMHERSRGLCIDQAELTTAVHVAVGTEKIPGTKLPEANSAGTLINTKKGF
jgi:hypothetical protein